MAKVGTATKIIIILLALLVGGFLAQTGIYVYKIKTGKINPYSFDKDFTPAKSVSAEGKMSAEEIIGTAAPSFGAKNPELTVVEFGNFACSHSKEESSIAREIMLEYKDKVKFIYRDYPLDDVFPNSSYLALAGKCASEQNNFWAMHDKLYASSAEPLEMARQIGLDTTKFSACMTGQKYLDEMNKDLSDGYKNGVAGTPTFFFIKKGLEDAPLKVQGAIPKDTFQQIINNLLK